MKKSFGPKAMAFPNPVWCVGSYDTNDTPNLMTIAWGGICCSKPPAVTISLRKATYTFGNIMARMAYTINIPSVKHIKEADYVGMASGKRENKFKTTGLTPVKSDLVDVPYVDEFPMILECKVIHTYEIGLHTQFIGEILDVKTDESVLNDAGLPDMINVAPFIYGSEVKTYHRIGDMIGQAYNSGKRYLNSVDQSGNS
jgi:flavin reductase (DIM6/NTAB) family NADH-FMN oxidoreductase RutF